MTAYSIPTAHTAHTGLISAPRHALQLCIHVVRMQHYDLPKDFMTLVAATYLN